MPTMKGKRVLTSLYLDPPIQDAIKRLSGRTRILTSVLYREAISDLLAKYGEKVAPISPPPPRGPRPRKSKKVKS